MAFKPTVETIGDAALATSIIDRSITELQDSTAVTLQSYSLASCSSLKKAVFSEVTEVLNHSFEGCEALETLDFYATVEFDASALQGLSSLETLILRSDTMCDASSSAVLSYTPIADGTGYIYVPAALVDSYKHDFVWGSYFDQIRAIEDYPLIANKYSWEAVQWSMDNGTYATDYAIGDTVPLDLGTEGVINMQIAAFDADDLADGSGKAKISWVAKELLTTGHRMNPARVQNDDGTYQEGTGSIGGWEKCEMRSYLKETIKPLIAETVASRIATVTKTHSAYDTNGNFFTGQTTEDDVWLLGVDDGLIYGGIYGLLALGAEALKKYMVGSSYASNWWLRSTTAGASTAFSAVLTSGETYGRAATKVNRIALGFCTN